MRGASRDGRPTRAGAALLLCTILLAPLPGCTPAARPAAPPAPAERTTPGPTLEVTVDQRIELLAIVFRLAGAEEYAMRSLPAYADAIDAHFAPHRDHPAVRMVAQLRERGISHDAVMSLAVHATPLPTLRPREPLEPSALESRWRPDDARAFLAAVADFARASDAERFFAAQAPMYRLAEARMRAMLAAHVDEAWFARFFGRVPGSRFVVAIAPGNGTWAYAARHRAPDGAQELYAVMNVWQKDSAGMPVFHPSNANVVVHEFAHSFVNPVVDADLDAVRDAAERIHARVAARMATQGYAEPRTMLSESIVRAAGARYVLARHGADSARRELEAERLRGFLWIDDLFALLGAYEQSRDRFPTFRDYAPQVAAYFRDLAPRIDATLAAFEARRPRVVAVTPAAGDTVAAGTRTLVVRFDRPMRRAWAVLPTAAGPDAVPQAAGHAFDESGTEFTMRVTLQPGRRYELTLNSPQVTGFVSREGVPLAPHRVELHTRP